MKMLTRKPIFHWILALLVIGGAFLVLLRISAVDHPRSGTEGTTPRISVASDEESYPAARTADSRVGSPTEQTAASTPVLEHFRASVESETDRGARTNITQPVDEIIEDGELEPGEFGSLITGALRSVVDRTGLTQEENAGGHGG